MPRGKAECVSASTSQRRKATGSSRDSTACFKLQRSATLEFTSENKVDVSYDFALVLSHWRMGEQGNGQGARTCEFSCSEKQGDEPCYNEGNYFSVCPTTSVLITTCCFKGAKVFLGFADKKNCCTENLLNHYGLLKNNINDKLIIMNTVCFSLRPDICALQICHPSSSWPPCWARTKDIIRAFFFVKKIEKYLSWKK